MSSSVATRAGTQVTALPPAPPGTETPRAMNGGGSARDRSNAALVPQSEGGKTILTLVKRFPIDFYFLLLYQRLRCNFFKHQSLQK